MSRAQWFSSVQSLSHVRLFVTPWTVDCQVPLFMEFFRQEYWSGLPTSPGVLPDLGIDLGLLHCRQILYHLSHQGSPTSEHQFSSVQLLSHVRLYVTPWTAAYQASLSITNSQSLLKLMSIEPVMPSNHLILCCPLLLPPSIFPSIRVFSNESVLHIKWPKNWSFSFSISPSNEYGLVGSPCSPRDSQESYPTLQFKSINYSALSFLYRPTLTSIYGYWKNHSFDQMDLC